ncbi:MULTISPECIES: cytochrome d ubiquinol oxidase subunit II [Pseudoalteromonas]|uniref:Cytochrome d terminal oxidase, polypeptide subunit II n=1 Tax=Pseudoalteromonas translucida (strain TAC 125) TaxID=326442 RepID=Q3IIW6_PSET1|nr:MULTISPECIES: cytochrome d ubiquinol oxidase subunit II [Pseudoalteromonas]CAI87075.1 cytochrome d terminal oxidase, polypeptide subunit II [Pseudoalteromonas translucida]MBB1406493.1 cytochrome d ubiquinol oxidase subunit II [Pseudoalteromonas sp. SG44-5]MBE0418934.1 cytochrome d ubiquinol oxidase subunit II [Pseudoalteromonas nigrifaciens]PCC13288.1 cytochrome d ubiquinol oxidase subunit II [Pseudoalteromonas sp. JB197]WMS93584.1 cytochrome d ubiquinol oxidase subunit II [Pseudoalteromona|tara:strand:+ start:8237 stop:9376 length:1140 start_codon:yes stop_codon:yes gene_type:complete
MIFDYETLKMLWWLIIGILLIGFAITDGMDMGVAMLLRLVGKTDSERRTVINTIGPHWDGNQVWFITAGGALFAAWPMVYAAAFSGFYFAMMLVLFALFFRPLGFDYRSKVDSKRWRNNWDWGLFAGSAIPALVFGVAFGNLFLGVPFSIDNFLRVSYQGSFFALLNPFALLVGVISITMLIAHAGMWLQLRTASLVAERSGQYGRYALILFIVLFAAAGFWVANLTGYQIVSMPDTQSHADPLAKVVTTAQGAWLTNYSERPWTMTFPILAFAMALSALLFSKLNKPALGLASTSLMLIGIIMTAGVSLFPFIMPSSNNPNISLTIWDAVSSHMTLNVMFVAVVIFVPIILSYTTWCYVKMWRRVTVEEIENNPHGSY